MSKKKTKPKRLSDIKFDKNSVIKGKKLEKLAKKVREKCDEIDKKREVDWDKLSRTYITI